MKRWKTRDKKPETVELYMDILKAEEFFKFLDNESIFDKKQRYPDNFQRYIIKSEFGNNEGKYV